MLCFRVLLDQQLNQGMKHAYPVDSGMYYGWWSGITSTPGTAAFFSPSLTAGLKDAFLFNRLCFAIMPLWHYTVGLNGVDLKDRFLRLSRPVGNPEGIIDDLLARFGPAGFAHMDCFAVLAFEFDGDADPMAFT
jgi:hypothetical protein